MASIAAVVAVMTALLVGIIWVTARNYIGKLMGP